MFAFRIFNCCAEFGWESWVIPEQTFEAATTWVNPDSLPLFWVNPKLKQHTNFSFTPQQRLDDVSSKKKCVICKLICWFKSVTRFRFRCWDCYNFHCCSFWFDIISEIKKSDVSFFSGWIEWNISFSRHFLGLSLSYYDHRNCINSIVEWESCVNISENFLFAFFFCEDSRRFDKSKPSTLEAKFSRDSIVFSP